MEKYKKFYIRKKNGDLREILAPCEELKKKQRAILKDLYSEYLDEISPYAYGFVPGRNIVDNAEVHAGMKFILNVDIRDFFPSCRIKWSSPSAPEDIGIIIKFYSGMRSVAIRAIDEDIFYYTGEGIGYLPQGAPTSPFLSNLFMKDVDVVLPAVLRVRISSDIRYTRYADDITISSNSKAIFSPVCLKIIGDVLGRYGFELNKKKIRRMTPSSRQEITGLVVNSGRPTVSKKVRRMIRAAVHNAERGKPGPDLPRIKGLIAFCMQCESHREWGRKMLERLKAVGGEK
jgi:retron-type reverse transcriptase